METIVSALSCHVRSKASPASFASGASFIIGSEDLRDIKVINLDGLPEAEALRLLGVDEQGKDLRGKPNSAGVPSGTSQQPTQPPATPGASKSVPSASTPVTSPIGDGLKPTTTLPAAAPVR